MAVGYGQNIITQWSGIPLSLLADPATAMWKAGGITIDWSAVPVVTGADFTLPDGSIIVLGQKGLRLGQVMCRVTATGLFAPYNAAGAGGVEVMTLGDSYVLDKSILETPQIGPALENTTYKGALEGGLILKNLLLTSTVTQPTGSPAGPTLAIFLACFGANFRFIKD